jgi:hypothetical protein
MTAKKNKKLQLRDVSVNKKRNAGRKSSHGVKQWRRHIRDKPR